MLATIASATLLGVEGPSRFGRGPRLGRAVDSDLADVRWGLGVLRLLSVVGDDRPSGGEGSRSR